MNEIYLLLGSNEGNRIENLKRAKELIALHVGKIMQSSSIYETEAWGLKEQNNFLNQAVRLNTSLSAHNLLVALKTIEKETGRTESVKWGPRIIDIDILFYENEVVDIPELKIPHPFMHERRFTLVPLNEIASDFIHPVLEKTTKRLMEECTDDGEVTVISQP